MAYFEWPPYVSVASRRRQAEKRLAKLRKNGTQVDPVKIQGRAIAASFWGKSWCVNLERYSDYATRLPRGRSYVRNGCVLDLQIRKGRIAAMVAGSSVYNIEISIAPVAAMRWKAICRDCAGSIDSLIELLQGRFAKNVMDRVCREGDGLFPSPREIKLSCDCPDWADMCKHVAAVLYGVGARLDREPRLLFVLRGVDENQLLAGAGRGLSSMRAAPAAAKVIDNREVEALFGIEMDGTADSDSGASSRAESLRTVRKSKAGKKPGRRARGKVPKRSVARRHPSSGRRSASSR
jgi:uncharacterized Zn finger protein